ncbi:MAG: peptide chain release factor 2, partial [Firmicutes bacterium]|nr:peptide chain release factor 2 [Bacillota bacterium]
LDAKISDMNDYIDLIENEDDQSLIEGVDTELKDIESAVRNLYLKTLLKGEYDSNNAIIKIHSGAGGTEACDWVEILYRMYQNYANKKGFKIKLYDSLDGDGAGYKSVTFLVSGDNAYGYFKGEMGVHRLVRISPFNAQGKRQTSFSMIEVTPEIDDDINVEIDPDDIRVDTYRSSGAGGQHVNKTDSAIRITHLPTNIVVTCQNERSQHQNRDMAMKILKSRLVELAEQQQKQNLKELKGDFSQNTWGSQIRSYVFQPYTMVKDHRTGAEVGNVQSVMDGNIDYFINEKLKQK